MHSLNSRKILFSAIVGGIILCAAFFVVADIISRSSTTSSSTQVTLTKLVLAKPVVTEGDLLLASVAINGGSAAVIHAPTGWSQILRTDNDISVSLVSYWKIAGASEPSTYTWTIDGQTTAEGSITPYSGIDFSNPIDSFAGNYGFGTIATTASAIASSDNSMVVALFAADIGKSTNAGTYFSPVSGMTEKHDVSNVPFGPSIAADEALLAIAGFVNSKSTTISGNKARNWASQQIVLNPIPLNTADNFNAYGDENLSGLNGGTGWTSAWSGSVDFDIQGLVTAEGSKAVVINVPGGQERSIERSFTPKTTGTLHWEQRKDAPDHGSTMTLHSGGTRVAYVSLGSGGNGWVMQDGVNAYIFGPYTESQFDSIDLQFDTNTDMYRVSLNNGAYTDWKAFGNAVDSIDKIRLEIGASGNNVGNNYWDDIRFDN